MRSRVSMLMYLALTSFELTGCGGTTTPHATPSTSAGSTPSFDSLPAVATPTIALLALSKRDHTLAIVDPTTLKVVAKIPVGDDPHEVVASADGTTAYVSNYGSGALHTIAVVDLVHQKALAPIDLGALTGPHGLMARGEKLWFTAEGAKAVGSYDPAAKKINWILGTGQDRTHMIWVSPDLKQVFTTNVSSATVSILERGRSHHPGGHGPPPAGSGSPPVAHGPPGGRGHGPMGPAAGEWTQTIIAVGKGAEGFDVSPQAEEIWVANAEDGTISIIDVTTKTVTQTLAANVPGANRLKFTVDGKHALVSSLSAGNVAVFDTTTRARIGDIAVGHGAAGISMQPDGRKAYVACSPDGTIAVVDLETSAVVGRIDVGPDPDGLAWAARH